MKCEHEKDVSDKLNNNDHNDKSQSYQTLCKIQHKLANMSKKCTSEILSC